MDERVVIPSYPPDEPFWPLFFSSLMKFYRLKCAAGFLTQIEQFPFYLAPSRCLYDSGWLEL